MERTVVLLPLVPRRSEDPLVFVPLVPRRSGDPLLPVPLVPLVPTCANLCHLVVPLEPLPTLFSQIFFWVSQCHSIFGKTLLTEYFLQNTVDSIIIGVAKKKFKTSPPL